MDTGLISYGLEVRLIIYNIIVNNNINVICNANQYGRVIIVPSHPIPLLKRSAKYKLTHNHQLIEPYIIPDALRESQGQVKDLTRQVQDLLSIRAQLEAERDRLAVELSDAIDSLKDAQVIK